MNAIKAILESIVLFCGAFNRFGKAADHLGRYVEGGARGLADKAEIEREQELNKLRATTISTPALTAPHQQ